MRRHLRVALVVPNVASGGGVAAVARFVKAVADRSQQCDLRVVSLSESASDPVSLRLASPSGWIKCPSTTSGRWEGVPFVHVGAVAGEIEFQRYRVRPLLTRALGDCDVVQVVCGFPAWANAVLGLGKPVAMHVATRARVERRVRDAHPRSWSGWWRRGMTGITDRLDDRALRGVDAIQVMNPWMLDYARSVNHDRDVDLRYLPPGVDTRLFRPGAQAQRPDEPYVLCVGRLSDPRKSVEVLLDAYALLPEVIRRRVRLVLAGSTPPTECFWQRAQVLGLRDRITWVGRLDVGALVRLYQEASVFALPSDEEGFGMVLLEAMACAVPVVSTRCGGAEGIVSDGVDGYLVERADPVAMAARLARLLEDPALACGMGAQARRTVEQRYDDRHAGEAFLEIWHRMARVTGSV